MIFPAEPIDRVLRAQGLTLAPEHYLDGAEEVGNGRFAVRVLGRMGYQPVGRALVALKGGVWVVESLDRAKAEPAVFDDKLVGLAK